MAAPGSAEDFARNELRRGVFNILKDFGFSSAQESEINKLAEIWRRTILSISENTRLFMEASGKTEATVNDVLAALKFMNVSVTEIKEYAEQVNTAPLPALPMFPALGPTERNDRDHFAAMYGPRPSEKEMKIRPPHVPDHLPAMHPEWIDEATASQKFDRYGRKGYRKHNEDNPDEKADSRKPGRVKFKVPEFDSLTFDELGFIDEDEEDEASAFKSDLSAATGITSSANLPAALLAARGEAEAVKPVKVATPAQSPPREVVKPEPITAPIKFLDILKSRVNSPALSDRPSSSASVHPVEPTLKPIKFALKPVIVKPLKPAKKEKEPKPPPKPKGRPPKKRDDAALKKKKTEENFLANQMKQLEKFREEKEKREKQEMEEKFRVQLFKTLKERSMLNTPTTSILNPLKINLGKPINFVNLNSPKPEPVTTPAAATPPMPSLVAEVPPPVGAEVSIGETEEEEETIPFFDNSSVNETVKDFSGFDVTLNTTVETNTTADETISETPVKEKKKKHKDKIMEQSAVASDKKHRKKDKDSEEYKEYKRLKKEKKRKEREEKEKKEIGGEGTSEVPTPKVTLKIKFGDPSGLNSGNNPLSSISSSHQTTPMRADSQASDRPGSSRDCDKEPVQPSLKLKFKNLFNPAELAKNESSQKVPPLKLGAVPRIEEPAADKSNSATPSKPKKDKRDKEKKKDRKEKERQEREKEREHERERERERERENKRREEEKEKRREEERKELERIEAEKKAELERQRLKAIEIQKELERKEQERLKEVEKQKEAAEKAKKEEEKERERERRKDEKKKDKKHKKKDKSKSKDPSPMPNQARPIVPLLSADDDEDDDDEEVWICPVCSVAYTEGANMVGCDRCDDWFHWHCVGLVVEPAKNTSWFCQRCSGKKKHKELKRPGSRSEDRGAPKKKKKH